MAEGPKMTRWIRASTAGDVDLVSRLRNKAHTNDWYLRLEAADEIERLSEEPSECPLPRGVTYVGCSLIVGMDGVLYRVDAESGTVRTADVVV